MKNKITIICAIALLILVHGFLTIYAEAEALKQEEEEKQCAAAMPPRASKYDISYLESWCGEAEGRVRMVGGWYNSPDLIETEDGMLWVLNTDSINENEFLLVWFDDMGTDTPLDDQIIKIWSEVYD